MTGKPYHLRVPIVSKSGSLNLLEPSGPVRVCNGIALPLTFVCVCVCFVFVYCAACVLGIAIVEPSCQ
jgi:hypothetical protein